MNLNLLNAANFFLLLVGVSMIIFGFGFLLVGTETKYLEQSCGREYLRCINPENKTPVVFTKEAASRCEKIRPVGCAAFNETKLLELEG